MACSTSLRKSLSETSLSPRASRWAFMTIRRYLVMVTPGIATGYWKAMKRPMRARSSGAASVMSCPLNRIWPSVTSRLGWPMMALASVDLPEPLGPMRAWISPLLAVRSTPLRMCLSAAWTWRLRISRSAMRFRFRGGSDGDGRLGWRRRLRRAVGEGDELGERGLRQRLDHAALDAGPQQLGGTAAAMVVEVRAQHAPVLGVVDEAAHRCDGALEREDDLVHGDRLGGA